MKSLHEQGYWLDIDAFDKDDEIEAALWYVLKGLMDRTDLTPEQLQLVRDAIDAGQIKLSDDQKGLMYGES